MLDALFYRIRHSFFSQTLYLVTKEVKTMRKDFSDGASYWELIKSLLAYKANIKSSHMRKLHIAVKSVYFVL
uniref:Uncharacterized protein n=1 Tax=Octopus bimaculoides TaxID=37653 RepID=A0A0L8GAV4_OCTBM